MPQNDLTSLIARLKKYTLFLVVLVFSSNAFAEWSGDTLRPVKVEGCYEISTPEEYAWMVSQPRDQYEICFKLVSDIVLGKDKKSVHREHQLKPIAYENMHVDFNGYSVYGAYTEEQPFIIGGPRNEFKDISFKNFEIHVKDSSWSRDQKYISAVNLQYCIRDYNVEGNVVAEGAIKATGDSVSVDVLGGSFVDGVLENRTSLTVDANFATVVFSGVAHPYYYGIDSNRVTEAVNYADVSVKAKRALGAIINGVCPVAQGDGCKFYENLNKFSNYGNIVVEIKDRVERVRITGIGNYEKRFDSPLELYNEGNISVKTDTLVDIGIAGLSMSTGSYAYRKYARAENRGNISVLVNRSGKDRDGYSAREKYYIVGCFGQSTDSVENLFNEGNIDVHLGNFVEKEGSVLIGGITGSAPYIKNAMNVGTINASMNKALNGGTLSYFTGVGGIAGVLHAGGRIERSANFGKVNAEFVEYVGGVVGYLEEADAVQVMNFADVTAKETLYLGGIAGALHGACFMRNGTCYRDARYLNNLANLGNVIALDSTCLSVGGLAGESYENFYNSYNVGKVTKNVSADSVDMGHPFSNRNTVYKGSPDIRFIQTYYNWNVYYGTDAEPEDLSYEKNARTTAHMQSSDFVKELNYVDSTNTDSKVWSLTKLFPYPIIADMEGMLKEGQEKLSIPERRPNRIAALFNLKTDGLNIVVSGAKMGSPYGVFTLLGKSVSRGRISSQDQTIPVASSGTYIVKVGRMSRKIIVK